MCNTFYILELQSKEDRYETLFKISGIIDLVSMVIFIAEIIVKWIDSFTDYWKDGWNVSDFFVTVVVWKLFFIFFFIHFKCICVLENLTFNCIYYHIIECYTRNYGFFY